MRALRMQAGGNISQASRMPEIPGLNLYEKLKKYGRARKTPTNVVFLQYCHDSAMTIDFYINNAT